MRVGFEISGSGTDSRAWLQPMLDALTAINLLWLDAHPSAPSIYSGGVRYVAELPGREQWRDLPTVLASGVGDCEDLATARAAELQARGVRARAVPRVVSTRSNAVGGVSELIHIVVRLPGGRIEDPSAALGMPGPA